MPDASRLKKVRQEIDYNWADFKSIINQKEFLASFKNIKGESLVRPPKGYEEDNPAIQYLKHKSLIIDRSIDDNTLLSPHIADYVDNHFIIMQPFIEFLNTSL